MELETFLINRQIVKYVCFDEPWALCLHLYFTWYTQNMYTHFNNRLFCSSALPVYVCTQRDNVCSLEAVSLILIFKSDLLGKNWESTHHVRTFLIYAPHWFVLFVVPFAWFEPASPLKDLLYRQNNFSPYNDNVQCNLHPVTHFK